MFFSGFAAILKVPGLTGADIDLSLFKLSIQTFDPWFVGVIGGAGVLTALVPGSMILIAATTFIANDLVRPLSPKISEDTVTLVARASFRSSRSSPSCSRCKADRRSSRCC